MDVRLTLGTPGVVTPGSEATAIAIERRRVTLGDYNIASIAATVTVIAEQSIAAWMFSGTAANAVGITTLGITRQGGARGPKGDTGDPTEPIAIVSALPSTPYDGQIIHYQNAGLATLGRIWVFRYKASESGSYKWTFIGGRPYRVAFDDLTAGYTTGGAPYTWGPATDPKYVFPLGGDFDIDYVANCQSGATSDLRANIHVNGVSVPGGESFDVIGASKINGHLSGQGVVKNVVSGHLLDLRLRAAAASVVTNLYTRSLSITPIRVG
jgi:hypothetical protein